MPKSAKASSLADDSNYNTNREFMPSQMMEENDSKLENYIKGRKIKHTIDKNTYEEQMFNEHPKNEVNEFDDLWPPDNKENIERADHSLDWEKTEEMFTNLYEAIIKLKDLSYYNLRHHAEKIKKDVDGGLLKIEDNEESKILMSYMNKLTNEKSSKSKYVKKYFKNKREQKKKAGQLF